MIVLDTYWSGHGNPKTRARFYDKTGKYLGSETVFDENDAKDIGENGYGLDDKDLEIEDKR